MTPVDCLHRLIVALSQDIKAVYPQSDGTERGATFRVVVGEYPMIVSAVELHGGVHPDLFGTLFGREVDSIISSEGFLIPTGVRWSSTTIDLSLSFDVKQIGRIDRSFAGLWEFGSPTGTRFVTDKSCEMKSYRVPYSDSDEAAIRAFLASRGVRIGVGGYLTRTTLIVVTSIALFGLAFTLIRYRKQLS